VLELEGCAKGAKRRAGAGKNEENGKSKNECKISARTRKNMQTMKELGLKQKRM
jgi:hypothetical protein